MKAMNLFTLCILIIFSPSLFAYGGGGGGAKSCKKPEFSNFSPAEMAEVTRGSVFSFTASKITSPSSIKVTVKKIPREVEVTDTPQGYRVQGTLPESLQGTFARINIEANSNKRCFGSGGWLIKVSP